MKRIGVVLICAGIGLAGCAQGRKSAAGFRLPDGDPVRGRQVFVEMKCHTCHRVAGVDLPAPVADPPVGVTLGGVVASPPTDGTLVTAIIDPSHERLAAYPPERVASGRLSRMGDFSEAMRVRDLIDLVAFLQSRYEIEPPIVPGP